MVRWTLSARKNTCRDRAPVQRTRSQLWPPTLAVWGVVSWLTSTGDTTSELAAPEDNARQAHRPGHAGTGEKDYLLR